MISTKQKIQGSITTRQSLQGTTNNGNHIDGSITMGRPLATIKVVEIEGGYVITVTDPGGIQELSIMDGKDGYTPKKGIDYFTDEEKEILRQEILEEFSNFSPSRIDNVTLLADKWDGDGTLYSQIVSIKDVTKNSQVDLTPSVEQLTVFYEKDVTFVTENENGVVTVFAIGQKPQNDYTIQVTITEVGYE